MFRSLDVLVFGCLFLTAETQTGQILPPQNVSLLWISDFEPVLRWAPPPHSVTDCTLKYQVTFATSKRITDNNELQQYIVMEGGFLQISIQTVCNNQQSETKVLNVTYPVMVKNMECYLVSSKEGHCSWEPAIPVSNLSFFYRMSQENFIVSIKDDRIPPLQECPFYTETGKNRTDCKLNVYGRRIHILFNGTVNGRLSRNTFTTYIDSEVRAPPLVWTVTKAGDNFNISWIPPAFENMAWNYKLKYTECGKQKPEILTNHASIQLPRLHHCQYTISLRAETIHGKGGTPWSDEKYFNADKDPNTLVYIAVIIPLVSAGLAILTFVCCRKNKERIFPKVPEPRDFLSDISENYKSTIYDLYIPAEEEENCSITLEKDT